MRWWNIKIINITDVISDICITYYLHHSRNKNRIYNLDINRLKSYISFSITTFFKNQYPDDPDLDSIDISSSLYSKRFNINTLSYLPDNMIADANELATVNNNISGTDSDYIGINVVPFDGFTIYGSDILSIINYYIY